MTDMTHPTHNPGGPWQIVPPEGQLMDCESCAGSGHTGEPHGVNSEDCPLFFVFCRCEPCPDCASKEDN